MSVGILQNLTLRRFRLIWLVFILFYIFICSITWLYAVSLNKMGQAKVKQVRAEQIKKLLSARNIKDSMPESYYQSIYDNSGGINPGFRNVVARQNSATAEPKQRAYEQQLEEYKRVMAEKERIRKENERRQAEETAREMALIEQEKAELLRQEQELRKAAEINTAGGVGPSKTFTPRSTAKPTTPQKTQIGKLKTSKLGESTFK